MYLNIMGWLLNFNEITNYSIMLLEFFCTAGTGKALSNYIETSELNSILK